MNLKNTLKSTAKKALSSNEKKSFDGYYKRYNQYSFVNGSCENAVQYEASITRFYHTIEKGLAYTDFRPGFGKDNLESLLSSMEEYAKSYDVSAFFYQTALSVLNAYIAKNKAYGYTDSALEDRIHALPGTANDCGGILSFDPSGAASMNFEELVKSRHSMRHFSDLPLDMEHLKEAIGLAQYTPSACNRQGWKCYIVEDKKKIEALLKNQNGNRGFGNEFDKLLLITGDLRAFNRDREVFQVYIDGGMYAMRVLDSLYYAGIAACPLSASLTPEQEKNAREILSINDAEVFILYIGVGNYPNECQTTRSERHLPNIEVQ